jgi:hypothetical protein
MKPKQPAGPAMTLGNMRDLGVHRLVASCLNDACRHVALIDVSAYPAETEVPSFRPRPGRCLTAALPSAFRASRTERATAVNLGPTTIPGGLSAVGLRLERRPCRVSREPALRTFSRRA